MFARPPDVPPPRALADASRVLRRLARWLREPHPYAHPSLVREDDVAAHGLTLVADWLDAHAPADADDKTR